MKTIITKYYFNQRYPIIFFCNDKDIINQLSEEQLKTIKLRECNICFINFFDITKINLLDSKNIYFNKDIIMERIIFNLDKLNSKLQKFNYTFKEKDIFINWNDMNNPGIDTQSLANFANKTFKTGKIPSAT